MIDGASVAVFVVILYTTFYRFIPFMYTTDLLSVCIDKRYSIYYCTLNYNISETEKCAVGRLKNNGIDKL